MHSFLPSGLYGRHPVAWLQKEESVGTRWGLTGTKAFLLNALEDIILFAVGLLS